MQSYRERVDPLVIARAEGSRIFDVDGRSYLDGNASWWTSTLGHGHPRLVEALRRQAQTLCHTALAGIAHEGASELAERICAVAPRGLEHVFFSDDGLSFKDDLDGESLPLPLRRFRRIGASWEGRLERERTHAGK